MIYRANNLDITNLNIDYDLEDLLEKLEQKDIETQLWVLSNQLEIKPNEEKVTTLSVELISKLNYVSLSKQTTKGAFLAFTYSFLKAHDVVLEMPYPTLVSLKSPFFGIIIETLLKTISNMESERKTISLDENTIRNRFLNVLKIRFEGLASSETFRNNGSTDILIKNPNNPYEEIVIECKIWNGKKYYQDGIKQSIGYLLSNENEVIILSFFKDDWLFTEIDEKVKEAILDDVYYLEDTYNKSIYYGNQYGVGSIYYYSKHKNKAGTTKTVYHITAKLIKT